MSDEQMAAVDRNDPELKYLTVEKTQFNDPATQAEWTLKRLMWVPHETQVITNIEFLLILKIRSEYRKNGAYYIIKICCFEKKIIFEN